MRGIVVGTVFSLTLWAFLAWCGVCACEWLDETGFSTSAMTLVTSLACIVVAGLVSVVWIGCLASDDAKTSVEVALVSLD